MGISMPQLLIILLIVVLLFGAKRLRNLGKDLGDSVKGFRQAMKEDDEPQSTEPKSIAQNADPSTPTAQTKPNQVADGKASNTNQSS